MSAGGAGSRTTGVARAGRHRLTAEGALGERDRRVRGVVTERALAAAVAKIAVDITYEKNQKFLVISIQDFGVGIAESQMQHLFVSLLDDGEITQSLQYTKPSVQLPQAKMRIEASGGSLSLISTLHIGTTALLKIPYQLLAHERIQLRQK